METRDPVREGLGRDVQVGKHRSALGASCAAGVAHTSTRQAPREEGARQREPREPDPGESRSLALRRSLVSRADAWAEDRTGL